MDYPFHHISSFLKVVKELYDGEEISTSRWLFRAGDLAQPRIPGRSEFISIPHEEVATHVATSRQSLATACIISSSRLSDVDLSIVIIVPLISIASYSMIWFAFPKMSIKESQGASIRCLNDWISGFVAPLPELCTGAWGHFPNPTVSEVLLLLLLTAISPWSPWSMFSTNSPWSSVSGGFRSPDVAWNMTCIMIHHGSSRVSGSNTLRVRVFDLRNRKPASPSIPLTSPCPPGNCLTPAHRTSWYY